MANVSPLASSALTVTAVQITPTVEWAINGFHGAPPENLASLIAGVVVLVLHAGLNWLMARATAKLAPSTPVQ